MSSEVWDEIPFSFPNFNDATDFMWDVVCTSTKWQRNIIVHQADVAAVL